MRKELAKEDQEAVSRNEIDVVHKNISPSVFILQGLEIEEAQYVQIRSYSRTLLIIPQTSPWSGGFGAGYTLNGP